MAYARSSRMLNLALNKPGDVTSNRRNIDGEKNLFNKWDKSSNEDVGEMDFTKKVERVMKKIGGEESNI